MQVCFVGFVFVAAYIEVGWIEAFVRVSKSKCLSITMSDFFINA